MAGWERVEEPHFRRVGLDEAVELLVHARAGADIMMPTGTTNARRTDTRAVVEELLGARTVEPFVDAIAAKGAPVSSELTRGRHLETLSLDAKLGHDLGGVKLRARVVPRRLLSHDAMLRDPIVIEFERSAPATIVDVAEPAANSAITSHRLTYLSNHCGHDVTGGGSGARPEKKRRPHRLRSQKEWS